MYMRMVSGAMVMMMRIHVFYFSFATLPSSMDKCKPVADSEKSIKRISDVHASNYSFGLGL